MPTDSYGNEYIEMWGRSRLVTAEQKQAIIARDHADRGCCENKGVPCRDETPRSE